LEMQPVPEQFTKPPEVRGGERRQRARHSPSALTYVTLGDSNGGIIANISETGMYVTAGEPLRENFLSRVSFRIPQTDGAIETQAEIVWTSESKKEAGVRFVELREESRELIRKWVAPARRNGNPTARPKENSRDGEKRATLPPASAPANESASAAAAAKSTGSASGADPREVIRGNTPEPVVPREPPPIPTAVARGIAVSEKDATPLLAFTGYGPRAWALTEAQRAEFERLFPSESAGAATHESATPEITAGARPGPIAERFASYAANTFVAPSAETPHEGSAEVESEAAPTPTPVVEPEATIERESAESPPVARGIPTGAVSRAPMQSLRDAPPPMTESAPDVARPVPDERPTSRATFAGAVPRTPMQSLWDAPPPMMQPIIGGSYGRGFGSAYGAPATEPFEDRRPRSTWSLVTVAILVVAACFVLGFVMGPDGVRALPKVNAARGVVAGELNHLKSVMTNSGGDAGRNAATAPAVNSNPAPNGQNAPTSSTPPASTAAPPTGAPALDTSGSGAPAAATPVISAPDAATPAAENSKPHENVSPANAAPVDSGGKDDSADTAPAAAPAPSRTESAAAKKPDSARAEAESRRAAREAQIEKERDIAEAYAEERAAEERAAANAAHAATQPTKPPVTAETAKPATSSPSRTEAPSAPAAHPAETTPHPAGATASPQSYFPVVAPGAGNVPRLIQLPEERVIDTAAVVIHSHQYVFVPAEPGPESSHALEKLRVGDRITKMAPMYPAEAAQKAMGGTVHVRAIIGKDGRVEDVRPINGPLMLITAAVDAILQWRYQPTLLEEQPIEMQEDFTVEFRPLGLH
jgi:TonB family protein